jgi:hypothetical protein
MSRNLVASLIFTLLTLVVLMTFSQQRWLKQVFSPEVDLSNKNYFTAIIDDSVDVQTIERKVSNLPGVSLVKMKNISSTADEVMSNLKGLDIEGMEEVIQGKYYSLKIFLNNQASREGQNLIREYLTRLVGNAQISISSIKTLDLPTRIIKGVVKIARNIGDKVIIGISFLIWTSFAIFFILRLSQYAKVVQFYQRKKGLLVKMTSILSGILFLIALGVNSITSMNSEVLMLGGTMILSLPLIAFLIDLQGRRSIA